MKAVAYTLYVVTVLLISGLARANAATLASVQAQYQTAVNVSQVAFDASKSELLIAGSLPNPCFGNPSAMMTQDKQNPQVLVLRLTSPVPMNACISRVKYFDTSVAMKALASVSHLNIERGTVYTLKVDGSEFELPVNGSDLL